MVNMIDRQIGAIMDLLKKLKIDDNTIVFVCGDNGGNLYFRNEKHPHGFFAPNVEEQNNAASKHRGILERMIEFAEQSHTPHVPGKILDRELCMKDHNEARIPCLPREDADKAAIHRSLSVLPLPSQG